MTIRRYLGLLVTFLGFGLMVVSALAVKSGVFFLIGIPLGLFSFWIFRKGKQLKAVSAEELIASDQRQPILYLRSFQSDAVSSRAKKGRTGQKITGIPQNVLDEEEQIALAMNKIGPFIAIGKPGEVLPNLGAARTYQDDDSWQDAVRHYANMSSLVLLRVGETAGFCWELENISRLVDPERIIFLLPEDEQGYQAFREEAERNLPTKLPLVLDPPNSPAGSFGGVLWFEPNWIAHVERCGNSFFPSMNKVASELYRLIYPAIKQLGLVSEHRLSGFGRRFVAFMADIAILGTMIAVMSIMVAQLAPENPEDNFIYIVLVAVFLSMIYFALEGTSLRATPGKKLMRLEVTDQLGVTISFFHAFLRQPIWIIEFLFLWPGLVSIVMLLLRKKTITDRLTRTQVIEVDRAYKTESIN